MTIKEKLKEKGVDTDNVYPKKILSVHGIKNVSLYTRELVEPFYFEDRDKIYKIDLEPEQIRELIPDSYEDKFLVPKDLWHQMFKEEEDYVEKENVPFSNMTLRDYACIHLGIADTEYEWLNKLIKMKK